MFAAWSLVPVDVVHRLAVKFLTVSGGPLTASRKASLITLTIVVVMINMAIEIFAAVIPGSYPDKHTAREPLGAVVPVGSAIVRGLFIIPIRTFRGWSYLDRNLR